MKTISSMQSELHSCSVAANKSVSIVPMHYSCSFVARIYVYIRRSFASNIQSAAEIPSARILRNRRDRG